MGKASRWFRGLFGFRKPGSLPLSAAKEKEKRRWSFVKSYREKQNQTSTTENTASSSDAANPNPPPEHAMAVAAATVVTAKAAVAAAQAAAAVVRMTSSRSCANATSSLGEDRAVVKIQAAFRGYLARRALRALKGLVRLQALVRGHIVRKQTVVWLRQVQALVHAQARAREGRTQVSDSPTSSAKSHLNHIDPATPEKLEYPMHARSVKFNQRLTVRERSGLKPKSEVIDDQDYVPLTWKSDEQTSRISLDNNVIPAESGLINNETDVKILKVDTWNPHISSKRKDIFPSSQLVVGDDYGRTLTGSKESADHHRDYSSYSCEVLTYSDEFDGSAFCTGNNSPHFLCASSMGESSKRSPITLTKSHGTGSSLSSYTDCPSYMACTESSRAKLRSLSAPRQRPQSDRSSFIKRYSIHGLADMRSRAQRNSSLHANFTTKAYPGSGRLDRLGLPVGGGGAGYRY